ncbi:MAG: serine/threonine-protein phosphatase [Lachnospiraceae bacterium]|nr:serine/threonine-protein phosphatase [Lachnospiraceae bacterium]
MKYIAAYHTDIGITKKTNQDSLAMKVVDTKDGRVAFAIVCDGMGGLSKGELASKEVILAFCSWFDEILLTDIDNNSFEESKLIQQWNDIIQVQNKRLGEYGKTNNIQLGTTVSALLIYKDCYYIVHVGDSRIYHMGQGVTQLTKDQTFIAREIAAGRLTEEQAKTDPRRSVLLQCVGASPVVQPEFTKGDVTSNTVYMLCSDGFRHQITDKEMMDKIGPDAVNDEEEIKFGCIYLTELVKNRRETDNITVAVLKAI